MVPQPLRSRERSRVTSCRPARSSRLGQGVTKQTGILPGAARVCGDDAGIEGRARARPGTTRCGRRGRSRSRARRGEDGVARADDDPAAGGGGRPVLRVDGSPASPSPAAWPPRAPASARDSTRTSGSPAAPGVARQPAPSSPSTTSSRGILGGSRSTASCFETHLPRAPARSPPSCSRRPVARRHRAPCRSPPAGADAAGGGRRSRTIRVGGRRQQEGPQAAGVAPGRPAAQVDEARRRPERDDLPDRLQLDPLRAGRCRRRRPIPSSGAREGRLGRPSPPRTSPNDGGTR